MQKIVSEKPIEITVDNLCGSEIIAYRTNTSGESICVLSKLDKGNKYGFINLKNSNSHPVFVADGWFNAVRLAAAARTVYSFNNIEELLESISKNKF